MEWYLIPVILAVTLSMVAYGIANSFNFPTTGFSAINQGDDNKTESNYDNGNGVASDNVSDTAACPDSCSDDDSCTADYCNERTNYTCTHEPIIGCCDLGRVYCNGSCVITRCIVDKDCDDGLSHTEDKCINSNSCNSTCTHTLIQNICGNGVCEGSENYSTCSKDCSLLAPTDNAAQNNETYSSNQTKILKVSITTDKETAMAGDNVTISFSVSDGLAGVYNASLNASIKYPNSTYIKYPSKTNTKVQNYTDESGLLSWIFSTTKTGTFNISVIASKDGYQTGSNYSLFSVSSSTS